MRRSGFVAFVLASIIGSLSVASAQAPQPSNPATAQTPPPGSPVPAAQPGAASRAPTPAPRSGAAPATPGQDVRRPLSYRSCVRAAKRRGLRGAQRRSFITRCRIGRENLNR